MTRLEQQQLDLTPADHGRIAKQRAAVLAFMRDGRWRALSEISHATGAPEASVSARLREFRKPEIGGWTVDRRRRFGSVSGTWEYRMTR